MDAPTKTADRFRGLNYWHRDGGCTTCGEHPSHLVVWNPPPECNGDGLGVQELACQQHASTARRAGAMTYRWPDIRDYTDGKRATSTEAEAV